MSRGIEGKRSLDKFAIDEVERTLSLGKLDVEAEKGEVAVLALTCEFELVENLQATDETFDTEESADDNVSILVTLGPNQAILGFVFSISVHPLGHGGIVGNNFFLANLSPDVDEKVLDELGLFVDLFAKSFPGDLSLLVLLLFLLSLGLSLLLLQLFGLLLFLSSQRGCRERGVRLRFRDGIGQLSDGTLFNRE